MASKTPHVLILGAGLGGLTLAQLLRKKGISYEIFERDKDADDRLQGWAIALHSMVDDFHASMPGDMPPFEEVNTFGPSNFCPRSPYGQTATIKSTVGETTAPASLYAPTDRCFARGCRIISPSSSTRRE